VRGTATETGISECWLHSDDTVSVGPRALKPLLGARYMERVPCLDCKLNEFQTCSLLFFIGVQVVLKLTAEFCYVLQILPGTTSCQPTQVSCCVR